MGLDISVRATNQSEWEDAADTREEHTLSRRFGYFMCRRSAIAGVPELDQLGALTGVDISPLYEMETYVSPEDIDNSLEFASDEAERQRILDKARPASAALTGNIDKVRTAVEGLLTRLATVADLPGQLRPDKHDVLQAAAYFANFSSPKMNARDSTFGQDLRNLKRFLEDAKSQGSETVYFVYS